MYKRNSGITLIALVVTIGILIIISGITLSSLNGENGIITKSKEAKEKVEIVTISEKIQNDLLLEEEKSKSGKLTESEIDNFLSNYGTVNGKGDDKTLTTKEKGYVIKVSDILDFYKDIAITGISAQNLTVSRGKTKRINITKTPSNANEELIYTSADPNIASVSTSGIVTGNILGSTTITIKGKVSTNVSTTCTVTVEKAKVSLTAAQIAANKEKYYGQVAENYTAGGLTYRIFYVDTENKFGDGTNTVYLKADYKTSTTLSDHITYNPEGNDLAVYKRMNPSWSAQRGSIAPASWNNNERAAGWLCSPTQWTDYLDNTKATYAIGGPSAEMYVASYNDVSHTQGGNYKLGATYRESSAPGYIYTLNGAQSTISNSDYYTGTDSLDYKGYNSMYAGKNGSKGSYYYWLASPSSRSPSFVCLVYSYVADLNSSGYTSSHGVGPLVSLKSGVPVEITE